MLAFLVRRLLHAVAVVALAATATFTLLQLAPGDPVSATLDQPTVPESVREAWRRRYGLDRPAPEQFARYVGAAMRGDLGWSFTEQRPVREVLGDALPRTALLMSTALALALAAGLALGAWQAWRPDASLPRTVSGAAVLLSAVPEFALGLVLLTVFSLKLNMLPSGGIADAVLESVGTPAERAVDRLRHLVMPAVALALGWTSSVARHQRAALRDVVDDDFVRTARAKGASERRVLFRHALRAAVAPTITLVGLGLPMLVGGAVVVESVFGWPGMGLVAARAVASRDYALVTGAAVAGSAAVALGSLLAALLVGAVDPRLRRPG
ncbi:ABC transporter permease [Roseisolibacter sp. H3M3-2]|uniref:ABC transporter permease n=1 Tax=Roseisolibacter sp. H3M3-2 TaxID=3031323 RepID=UPI0023DA569B|nr:ABC transporter permease [Roseisolibacter sp. H3M3-2]MDF1504094.1 ABC transporter permease [Roseisolibacter sp. H3M3-2]